jgi:CrcB protein
MPPSTVPWRNVAAVSLGGVIGALARYGLGVALPALPGAFPWSTFAVNAAGCLLIGVLMVTITEVRQAPEWVRPLLGVGVLGGFTTFSTYVVDTGRLLVDGTPRTALLYLVATPVAALAAVWAGGALTRSLARQHARPRRKEAR